MKKDVICNAIVKLAPMRLFFLFVFLGFILKAPSQVPVNKIDSIFKQWNNSNSPGCAVGIVRNDSLIFSKGYGMANLEYGIPNTPETIFHMASVSKQFTAYAIILLARQGKLSLEDDFRKYLTWFPDLHKKITIRQLLNHTSGIRDQWQLVAIQGTRLDDVITQDHLVKVIGKQQALNFLPGDEYSYSNSNFTLCAEIVKTISGQSFRRFTDSAIFHPLGMTNTHFHDDYEEIVKNRAYSYDRRGNEFANAVLSYSNVGATSLFTNVNDMSKWVMNFFNPKSGDAATIKMLTENGRLNNGKKIDYALGIASVAYNGYKEYSHSGGDAGFRTFVDVFPDLKMGFIVFSNIGDFNPAGKAHDVANLFVVDTTNKTARAEKKSGDTSEMNFKDSAFLKNYEGNYISDNGVAVKMELKGKKWYYSSGGGTYLLLKDSENTYSMFFAPEVKFRMDKDHSIFVTAPGEEFILKKYLEKTYSDDSLKKYVGTYHSPELDCNYYIRLKDHKLVLTNNKYNDAQLTIAGPDHLLSDYWWMNHLFIRRDKQNHIVGFEVNSGRIMHVVFDRQ